MSPLVQTIVALAALVYLLKNAKVFLESLFETIIQHSLRSLDELHHTIREEIRPSFDLWWESGPKQTALQQLRQKLPSEIAGELTDEDLEKMAATPLDGIKSLAWHLAIHSNMDGKEAELIAALPRFGGLRRRMIDSHLSHVNELEKNSSDLLDYGISPAALKAHFAPNG